MAKETIVRLTDDLDGSEAHQTVHFAVDGKPYEIDLSKKNADAFRKALEKYVRAGRSLGSEGKSRNRRGKAGSGSGRSRTERDYDIGMLREWAAAEKIEVPSRGRIPQAVVDRFKVATG